MYVGSKFAKFWNNLKPACFLINKIVSELNTYLHLDTTPASGKVNMIKIIGYSGWQRCVICEYYSKYLILIWMKSLHKTHGAFDL